MDFNMDALSCLANMAEFPTSCSIEPLFSYSTDFLSVPADQGDYACIESNLFASTPQSSPSSSSLSRASTLTSGHHSAPLNPLTELNDNLCTKISYTVAGARVQGRRQNGCPWINLGWKAFADNEKSTTPCLDNATEAGAHKHKCEAYNAAVVEVGKWKLERRRAQNRTAQHNYRVRQQAQLQEASNRSAELQTQVTGLVKRVDELEFENDRLKARNALLEYGQMIPSAVHADWQNSSLEQ